TASEPPRSSPRASDPGARVGAPLPPPPLGRLPSAGRPPPLGRLPFADSFRQPASPFAGSSRQSASPSPTPSASRPPLRRPASPPSTGLPFADRPPLRRTQRWIPVRSIETYPRLRSALGGGPSALGGRACGARRRALGIRWRAFGTRRGGRCQGSGRSAPGGARAV